MYIKEDELFKRLQPMKKDVTNFVNKELSFLTGVCLHFRGQSLRGDFDCSVLYESVIHIYKTLVALFITCDFDTEKFNTRA